MKYRKIPVDVEAYQWKTAIDQPGIPKWFVDAYKSGQIFLEYPDVHVKTSSVDQIAEPGDYILRDSKGQLSTCGRALFELTYERILTEGEVGKICAEKER